MGPISEAMVLMLVLVVVVVLVLVVAFINFLGAYS
jgi:hypothetical protein